MTLFQRFVAGLRHMIEQENTRPLWVEQVGMVADEEEKMVLVLLRCNEMLTNFMFTVRPFEFPLPLLVNTAEYTRWLMRFTGGKNIVPEPSELSRAVWADVLGGNRCGTTLDLDRQVFRVPRATFATIESKSWYSPEEQWAIALLDRTIPGVGRAHAGAITYHIIHVPNRPWWGLDDDEKRRVAELAVGWNYLRVFSHEYSDNFVELMEIASQKAELVVAYI